MKFAALVFLVSGLAYLVWDVILTISQGVHVGSLLMAVFAGALLIQANDLFRNKPGSRWRGIVSSLAIALASGYTASLFMLPPYLASLKRLPAEAWPLFGGAVIVFIAFSIVLVLLALSKKSHAS